MNGATLTGDAAWRLASYIEGRRRSIVATVVRSSALPRPGSVAASAFAGAFLDKLCQELEIGDRDIVDIWADAETNPTDAAEHARIVVIACATISSLYCADVGHSDEVVAYLAVRSTELERRFQREVKAPATFDPSRLVSRDEIVASLISAIDARDPSTGEHSRAVGLWCGRLARGLGHDRDAQTFATLAGTLHDIGKIGTPSEILHKPAALNDEEWDVMRAHSRIGAKMLERIPSLADLAPIVRAHHERIDGTGYPDGLSGNQIPMVARIVAVADAFHAMISKRPYRAAMPVMEALDNLRIGAGTQFEPAIVDVMIDIIVPANMEPAGDKAAGSGSGYGAA
jgi:putative nucleotidyltransferase with HDIG domain